MSTNAPSREPGYPSYPDPSGGGDLRGYLSVVRRRKWSLIFVIILTVGAAAFFSYRQTPMYRSTARVLVKPLNPNQVLQGYTYNFAISMGTEQQLATSPDVVANAAELADEAGDTGGDLGSVSASVPSDTQFLDISYSSTDAGTAQLWADAYARGYMEYRREQALGYYTSAKAGYDAEIQDLQSQIATKQAEWAAAGPDAKPGIKAEIDLLELSLQDLSRQSSQFPFPVAETAAEMVAPADLPDVPFEPNWTRNIAMALAAGLVLGLAVVFLRERLDDRLAGRDDLEEAAGAPVLAIVPHQSGWKRKSATKLITRDAPKTAGAEAYRTIRTNIGFMGGTNGLKLIALASPSMGEGKTTTTANLAVSLAHTGKRVIAVSCDLRKPRLHKFFDLSNDRGLTSVLMDGLSIPEVAQRVAGLETLRVVASGPIPHNPSELLGSDDMERLLVDLRRLADFVLIDTAPILAVSDALTIAPKMDGVLLIVDADATMRGAVRATREQLELVGANIVGAVLNDFDPSRARNSYGSSKYHYYGKTGYKDAAPAEAVARAPRAPVDPSEMWQ